MHPAPMRVTWNLRAINDWLHVSVKGGKRSAMRLGLAKRRLAYEDILWLGQRVPRPKRSRRKGMGMAA